MPVAVLEPDLRQCGCGTNAGIPDPAHRRGEPRIWKTEPGPCGPAATFRRRSLGGQLIRLCRSGLQQRRGSCRGQAHVIEIAVAQGRELGQCRAIGAVVRKPRAQGRGQLDQPLSQRDACRELARCR
jgi:hypothetical protein